MNGHLGKAQAALAEARALDPSDLRYQDLLVIARVQAEVAQAEALGRIADALERQAVMA